MANFLDVARANRDLAALNMGYTRVTAPVGGRVSRYVVTVGNLIQSGDQNGGTMLTTLVSVDPMYVYFDMDERTVLRVRQLIRDGKARSAREAELARLGWALATEEGFPHEGSDPISRTTRSISRTGTLRLIRGVFPNKDEAASSPGLFARVRVPIGRAHRGPPAGDRPRPSKPIRVRRSSTSSTRRTRWSPRPVRLGGGSTMACGAAEGLEAGERVIVSGLQQVRPGVAVEPRLADMPNGSQKSQVRGPSQKPGVNNGPIHPQEQRHVSKT